MKRWLKRLIQEFHAVNGSFALLTALLLAPLVSLHAGTPSLLIPPARFTQIRAISCAPPIRTAAENLRDFLKARGVCRSLLPVQSSLKIRLGGIVEIQVNG